MFMRLFPFFVIFLVVGFKDILLSWTSLPTAADGLSRTGFLGVCFVHAMFPIENKGYISIFRLQVEENKRGSCLLWVVYVSVLKLVLQVHVYMVIS